MAKEKRRNTEKRKEKSRDAARFRRSKETEIFTELAQCLPLPESTALQLDKASVMRLAISHLKIGDVLDAVGIAEPGQKVAVVDGNNNANDGRATGGTTTKTAGAGRKAKGKANTVIIANDDCEDKKDFLMTESQANHLCLKALEGFVFILSQDGDFVYLSENVAKYLGLQQIEVMGQSIHDFIHPCDYEEIRDALHVKARNPTEQHGEDDTLAAGHISSFTLRMKCTLTSKGRSVNLKSAPYKVMKCSGHLVISAAARGGGVGAAKFSGGESEDDVEEVDEANNPFTCSSSSNNSSSESLKPYLVVMMEPIPHPSNIEVPLDSSTFLSKHEMDMRFIFCDDRIEELAGYDHKAMVGQSFFDFHHAIDSGAIKKAFKDLFSKGQAVTQAYRMLAANGGYFWLVTQATTINNSRNQKPQCVVCVHYVLSGVEDQGVILCSIQEKLALSAPATATATHTTPPTPGTPGTPGTTPAPPMGAASPVPLSPAPRLSSRLPPQMDLLPPQLELSTESIFAPKTKDMDRGFCKPPDGMLYVNADQDDMSFLSPTAGEESVYLPFNDYKTEFLSSPMMSPCGSMKQELLSPAHSGKMLSPAPSSPLQHSADFSRTSSPADYLSCAMPLEVDSLDTYFASINDDTNNLSSTGGGGGDLGLKPMSGAIGLGEDEDDTLANIDFAMRAPYIPMDSDEDLDLNPPSSSTIFNLSKNDINPSVFGCTEFVFGPKQALYEEPKPAPKISVRDMLGESTVVASIEQPPGTMNLQMKRPLDMNCLEKGPPRHKLAKVKETTAVAKSTSDSEGTTTTTAYDADDVTETKHSVLLNLLLSGEDRNYGYKVSQKSLPTRGNKAVRKLEDLTSQDYEVNAPTQSCKLLRGQELLKALESL